jgi:hypothetical protein
MPKNITYLLGAGASANALPTINEINTRLVLFRDLLFRYITDKQRNIFTNDLHPAAHDLHESLKWVISNTDKHFTIDTFARKLFAISSRHPELRILKCVLSTFFVFEQIIIPDNEILREEIDQFFQKKKFRKQIPDKRYDNLISSLIEDEINNSNILGNIKIISWNYDSQFEYAYKEFWDFNYLYETHDRLQVIPGMWISEMGEKEEIDLDKFSLIHLNGLAGFKNIIGSNSITLLDKGSSEPLTFEILFSDLISYYDEIVKSSNTSDDSATQYFNYSWESKSSRHSFKSPLVKQAIDNAGRIAEITDILVVIGYSFPLFNRSIDNFLISKMEKLSKVYIQDLRPEMIKDVMINSFSLLQELTQEGYPKIDFVLSKNVDQFVLPYEI